MTRYADSRIAQRKPLPLSERDLRDLDLIRQTDTPQHRAVVALLGRELPGSEAATLHALFEIALQAIAEQAREDGYRHLAESRTGEDDQELRAARARRVRKWREEE